MDINIFQGIVLEDYILILQLLLEPDQYWNSGTNTMLISEGKYMLILIYQLIFSDSQNIYDKAFVLQ